MKLENYESNNSTLPELEANTNIPKRRELRVIFGSDDTDLWNNLIEIERKKMPLPAFIKQCTNYVIAEIKAGRNPLL